MSVYGVKCLTKGRPRDKEDDENDLRERVCMGVF